MINRREMKLRAKDSMRNAKNIYVIALVIIVINAAIAGLSLKLNYPGLTMTEIFRAAYLGENSESLYYAMMTRSLSLCSFQSRV